MEDKFLMLEIANLELDAKIGKDRHFTAADRKDNERRILGWVAVAGTAITASQATEVVFEILDIKPYQAFFQSSIALLVSLCTARLGFLGLEKQVTQHRYVGNMYIQVGRKARNLINRLNGGEAYEVIHQEFQALLENYLQINREGESCPTSDSDSKKAKQSNTGAHSQIKGEIKRHDALVMKLPSIQHHPELHLRGLVKREFKIKLARMLCWLHLVADADKQQYLKQHGRIDPASKAHTAVPAPTAPDQK